VTAPHSRSPATIRTGTRADVTAVLDLWVEAGAHRTSTDDASALETLLARDGDALLLAESDGETVGTLIASFDGWRGTMYRLAVVPDARRRGIARALVAEGERRLRHRGCRRATALIVGTDDHAIEFWTGVGYIPHPMERYVHMLDPHGRVAGPSGPPEQG
jgi:ribosomal protein S18 acetylase RimI-like enzyme